MDIKQRHEFSLESIREFVKKDFQSVSARMTKSLLYHYDKLGSEIERVKKVTHGELYAKIDELKKQLYEQERIKEGMQLTIDNLIANNDGITRPIP